MLVFFYICIYLQQTFVEVTLGVSCTLNCPFYTSQFCGTWRQYSLEVKSTAIDSRPPGFKPGLTTLGNLSDLTMPQCPHLQNMDGNSAYVLGSV